MELHTGLIEINWTSLMILINVFILYIVLKKFFWEKVKKFMDDRSASIRDTLAAAEATNRRADLKLEGYNKRISNIDDEGREIIKNAKATADKQAELILENARQEAKAIIEKAERTAEQEREAVQDDIKKEIAETAILVAEQIIGRELDASGQSELIDEAIDKVRSAQWQS